MNDFDYFEKKKKEYNDARNKPQKPLQKNHQKN